MFFDVYVTKRSNNRLETSPRPVKSRRLGDRRGLSNARTRQRIEVPLWHCALVLRNSRLRLTGGIDPRGLLREFVSEAGFSIDGGRGFWYKLWARATVIAENGKKAVNNNRLLII